MVASSQRYPLVRRRHRLLLTVIAETVALAGLLGGCAKVAPATPVDCAADLGTQAACRQPQHLRWLVPLTTLVGIQVTEEHGRLDFVVPAVCPTTITTASSFGEWRKCEVKVEWRFDGTVIWLINGDDVTGVNADTGAVVQQTTDPARAAELLATTDQDGTPKPASTGDVPPRARLGLIGNTAFQSRISKGIGDTWVSFEVGCVVGTNQPIPDALISHGAPAWAEICTGPVLFAYNQ